MKTIIILAILAVATAAMGDEFKVVKETVACDETCICGDKKHYSEASDFFELFLRVEKENPGYKVVHHEVSYTGIIKGNNVCQNAIQDVEIWLRLKP